VPVGAAHVELDEGAGQLILLPGRGLFAGAQAHDRIADTHRLPRLQRQVAADAVALVEQPNDGDPFGHRRAAGRQRRVGGGDRLDPVALGGIGGQILRRDRAVRRTVTAMPGAIAEDPGHRDRDQQDAGGQPAADPWAHPSGVHAS
jgi:hypothetical protein